MTITIKEVLVSKQNAKIVGAEEVDLEIVTGEKFGLPELTVTVDEEVVSGANVIINITGATADSTSKAPVKDRVMTITTESSWKTTADEDGDDAAVGTHYTSDGSEQVVITVTLDVTELTTTAFEILTPKEGYTSIEPAEEVAVANGANTEEITLTVTKEAAFEEGATVKVTVVDGLGATGAKTFEAKDEGGQTKIDITIGAGELTNINGTTIYVTIVVDPAASA